MPPEPFPWDRRDFRKHERSASDPRFGGGFGGAAPPRWRDQHAPPSHPPYHHNQQHQRRYADFRTHPLPPGHGKHTGWHMNPYEAGHGFPPHGSRLGDRSIGDENYRAFGSCNDGERHFRNSRENRGSFSQKYWRANSWEPASSPNIPTRSDETSDQRFIDNTQASHTSNDINNGSESSHSTHPTDSPNKTENPRPILQDHHSKDVGNVEGLTRTEKGGKESHLGSINWKPLKWSRSGSLSSRGSSLSRSNSSKSVGMDSTEPVTEVRQKNITPVHPPTAVAPPGVKVDVPVPYEDANSRKKPRLGWGEGLAKYEKKKVGGPENDASRSSLVVRVNDIEESVQSHPQHDKSPRFIDCISPATPLSIAFSSSPGKDEKDFIKSAIVDHDSSSMSCSPSIASNTPAPCKVGSLFSSDNSDLSSLAGVSLSFFDMLPQEDSSCRDISPLVVTKLLSMKSDILKTIVRMEGEIDSLETELRLLISDHRSSWSHPDASSSQGPDDKEVVSSNSASSPALLRQDMSGDKNVEDVTVSDDDKLQMVDENNNTNCVILKYVEMESSGKDLNSSQNAKTLVNFQVNNFSSSDKFQSNRYSSDSERTETSGCGVLDRAHGMPYDVQNICGSILASNQDLAISAFETLNKFLPVKHHPFDTTVNTNALCFQRSSSVARKNFITKKWRLQFKEKVLALKYKVFQHFWLQDKTVSVRKLRAMSHKNCDLIGHKKHLHNRSRMSASAWNSRFASVVDVIEVVRGLLADSSLEPPSRNVLKTPALMLDKTGMGTRFITDNGLVEDSYGIEKDGSVLSTWTSDEKDIFIDKLAMFGKDFSKIASFLDHKRTSDCVEFYYKNHKEDFFKKTWKKSDIMKQCKPQYPAYLVTSGKKWNREAAVASLDLLGEASAIVATADAGIEICEKSPSKIFVGASRSYKASRSYDGPLPRSISPDLYCTEREAAAADVLAGICGSLSSEAMSSCITSSIDHGEGYHDWRCQRVGFTSKSPLTPEVIQNVDDECSDESCGELDLVDWSDEEKSIFMQAISAYGRDFVMISQCVRTRSRDQCKVFFSKARKCLRLDSIQPEVDIGVSGGANGGGSDIEDASVLEENLVSCNVELECKMEEHHPHPVMKLNHESGDVNKETQNLKPDNQQFVHSCMDSLDPIDTQPILKNSVMDDGRINDDGCQLNVCRHNGSAVSSAAEPIQRVEASACSLHKSVEFDNLAFVQVLDRKNGKIDQEPEILSSNDNNVEPIVNVETESQLAGIVHPSLRSDVSGYLKESDHEFPTAEKSYRASLQLDDHSAFMKSSTLFPVPINYQKLVYHNSISSVGVNESDGEHSQKIFGAIECHGNVGGHTLSDRVEPTFILRGYPVSVPVASEEKNRSSSSNTMVVNQNAHCSDGNLHEFSLQKCTSMNHCEKEISRPSQEKTVDQSRASNLETPSRSGDVMLFGKIITSSQQKPDACGERKDGSNNQICKSICSTPKPKRGGDQRDILDSAVTKCDWNNTLGSGIIPVANFRYWDGNRQSTQTGLPDSALLLAKYPAAFASYPRPTPKMEQPPPVHGVSVFPGKDAIEYVKNGQLLPFTSDTKNPRDKFYLEMERRNTADVVNGIQQQSGRDGPVLSDPIAAIKMHYAKAELLIEEDEMWSKRDLGR